MPWVKYARTHDDYTFAKLKYELAHPGTTSSAPRNPSTRDFTGSSLAEPVSLTTPRIVDINNDLSNVENVANTRLWLPSDIPPAVRSFVAGPAIVKAELELLIAELHDCLVGIRKYRRALMITRRAYRGDEHASSAAAISARQREKISGIGEKIEAAKARYQAAWIAADGLDSRGSWSTTYRWLETKDIRGPTAGDDLSDLAATRLFKKLKGNISDLGQGTYEKSWIWCVALSNNTDPDDTLRVEWAKSSANAARWCEELKLVPEEMGRVLAYFVWHSGWWVSQVGRRSEASHELQCALDAYARRQASLIRQRLVLFVSSWLPALRRAGIKTSWDARYEDLVPTWAWLTPKRGDAVGCRVFFPIKFIDCLCLYKGERAPKPDVPVDFIFTSSQEMGTVLATPSSFGFDDTTAIPAAQDLITDVCDAVERDGVYAPPLGDHGGDIDDSDSSSSEDDSSSEDEDDDEDDDDMDDDDDVL
jgi:hypothetical protein